LLQPSRRESRRIEHPLERRTASRDASFDDARRVDTVEAAAISKCEAGDSAAGIPVLEDALVTARMPLPAPGYRWPGRSYSPT
jgi:hypothetical protein